MSAAPPLEPTPEAVWRRYDAMEVRLSAPLSERMLDLAGVGPGMRILDLATGRGEPAIRAARRVDSGYVWINTAGGQALGTPYGGMKQSGYGRDKVLEEMLSNTHVKNIAIAL